MLSADFPTHTQADIHTSMLTQCATWNPDWNPVHSLVFTPLLFYGLPVVGGRGD